MPNPLVDQGTLNLLRASVTISSYPALNVSASYLSKGALKLTFQGESVLYDHTLTGAVTSQQPYLTVEIEMALLKSQFLANLYKQQWELNALLGNVSVRGDAVPLGVFQFNNCSIKAVRTLDFSGQHAEYPVTLGGVYYINSSLFV